MKILVDLLTVKFLVSLVQIGMINIFVLITMVWICVLS